MSDLTLAPARDAPSTVGVGARVRDPQCGQVHTLRRLSERDSDALLVYECAAQDSARQFSSPFFETVQVGAIFGRLINSLELAE